MIKVAINGFGRIGRNVFKIATQNPDIEIVAINDLTDPRTLAHLLKYDSVHGRYAGTVESTDSSLIVNGKEINILASRSPKDLPWAKLGIDVAIECTGIFTSAISERGGYKDHLIAGAKKVILTVPAKDKITTVVLGVNDDVISPEIDAYSNASCTTNCLAPVVKIIHDNFGLKRGFMNTVHSFTADQNLLDASHNDLRRARAASQSIIPTSTGAARAVGLVLPELKGTLDGMAMRVPTPDGSVIDLTCELKTSVTKEGLNNQVKLASQGALKGIIEYTEDPIVSVDIIGNTHSSIFDASLTMVLGSNLVKIIAWYDNEIGYSNRVVDLIQKIV